MSYKRLTREIAVCSPSGSGGGQWHAASGNSQGWQQWTIDLDKWAGGTVEISIAYASSSRRRAALGGPPV